MSNTLKGTMAIFVVCLAVILPLFIAADKIFGLKAQYFPGMFYLFGGIVFSFAVVWGLDKMIQNDKKRFEARLKFQTKKMG